MARALLIAGLALALTGLFLGRAAVRFGWTAASHDLVMAEGDLCEVDADTSLSLDRFEIPRYASGKPRQYLSSVKLIDRKTKRLESAVVSVNHPLRHRGWWIYQYGWGPDETGATCTQLRCVRDVGWPVAALGGAFLLLGAFGFCLRSPGRGDNPADGPSPLRRLFAWVAALLTVSLPLFIIGRAVLRPEPVPALQSVLLAPHVAAYTASYLILLFAAFGIGRRFVPLGFLLMTTGLVLGAVWGKFAWTEWWQFDPKENWSFLTWLTFAAYLFVPFQSAAARWLLRAGAILIVITLTWVNFSRLMTGLHSYA